MYHFCRKIITEYLIEHGYISYSIATHLVKCNVPKQLIKKSKYGWPSVLSSRIMCDLKKKKKIYRSGRTIENERPGVYVISMHCSQISSHEQGKMDV
jgi:hypothetical protein